MIHRVTCTYCDRPIMGRVIKDEFKQTTCQDCLNGVTIAPSVAAPIEVAVPVKPAPALCTVEGCNEKAKAKKLCIKHYCADWRQITPTTCTIEGCEERSRSIGLCRRHYQADWRARQPKKPPVTLTTDPTQPGCIVVGCSKGRRDRGMCRGHRSYVRRHKLDHLLLPVVPPQIRNIKVRHLQEIEYSTPMEIMAKVVSLKLSGKTWHQAAKEAGCLTPTVDVNRIKNNYRRGKIPGYTPPRPHR